MFQSGKHKRVNFSPFSLTLSYLCLEFRVLLAKFFTSLCFTQWISFLQKTVTDSLMQSSSLLIFLSLQVSVYSFFLYLLETVERNRTEQEERRRRAKLKQLKWYLVLKEGEEEVKSKNQKRLRKSGKREISLYSFSFFSLSLFALSLSLSPFSLPFTFFLLLWNIFCFSPISLCFAGRNQMDVSENSSRSNRSLYPLSLSLSLSLSFYLSVFCLFLFLLFPSHAF